MTGYRIICFILFSVGVLCSSGVRAQVRGLENNAGYAALLKEEKRLSALEDSLQTVIGQTRKLFASDPQNRAKYSDAIMKLETELYEVRKNKGITTGRINAIEQEFILGSLSGNTGLPVAGDAAVPLPATGDTLVRNLVYAAVVKSNMPADDYSNLVRAQQAEPGLLPVVAAYCANHKKLAALKSEYAAAAKEIDALTVKEKFDALAGINRRLADSLSRVWNGVFDTKLYSYNLLLDKLDKGAKLSAMDARLGQMRQAMAETVGKTSSDQMAGYGIQKRFIQDYERELAGEFGLRRVADSVARAAKSFDTIQCTFDKIEIEERVFIDYQDVKVNKVNAYNHLNPIPENKVYSNGTVYKIHVGTFLKPQDPSIFRRVSPISYEKRPDGKYSYYVGAYATMEEAEKGVEELKRIGFRKPEPVVWRDGVFETLGEGAVSSGASDSSEAVYRVEITGMDETLPQDILDAVNTIGGGSMEIGRIPASGEGYIFTVGSFGSMANAQRLVDAVDAVSGYSAKIIKLGL